VAYRHILLATGGAEHSLRAEKRASELALELAARLTVVSVLRLSGAVEGMVASLPMDAGTVSAQVYEDAEARQRQVLEEAGTRCEAAGVKDVQLLLEFGSTGRVIVATAEERGCDLIVTGRRKLSALGAVALGSVSDFVNRHAPCDVLIVR
jgi:nucleotide-binding universal stress UspA family protein